MNALDMSFQKVRKTLMHIVPPPPPPRHPNLRELQRSTLGVIQQAGFRALLIRPRLRAPEIPASTI